MIAFSGNVQRLDAPRKERLFDHLLRKLVDMEGLVETLNTQA